MSIAEEDWLVEPPKLNQVLHDMHAETVEQMIDLGQVQVPEVEGMAEAEKRR